MKQVRADSQDTDKHGDEAQNIRAAILTAALVEFSHHGLQGARLDVIARQANCAKRMIFYYFDNKDGLYTEVLETSYSAIRASEAKVDLTLLSPVEALMTLAFANFDFHHNNREFSRLVLMENLQGGQRLQHMKRRTALRKSAISPLHGVIERGISEGVFRKDLDAVDVHYLISALCAFRVDHANSWQGLLNVDLLSPRMRKRNRALLEKAVLDFTKPDPH